MSNKWMAQEGEGQRVQVSQEMLPQPISLPVDPDPVLFFSFIVL